MGILEGKVIVITGGGQGIGEGLVYACCHEGAKVVNIGRTYEKIERVVNNIKKDGCDAIAIQCDVSERDQVDATIAKVIETYGKIDGLVVNHMTQQMGTIETCTEEDMYYDYKNNVLGTFHIVQACLPYLKETKGNIVNFASGSGTHGTANMFSYATSKEAIRGMTKCMAIELAKYDINVNCVVPTANSPAWEATKKANPDKVEGWLAGYLIRRGTNLGDPETDIGGIVVFLLSKYSQYMTSRTLFANGGKSFLR